MIKVDNERVQKLLEGLTSGQISDLLMQLINAMSEEDRKRFADELEPDVAEVFTAAAVSPGKNEGAEEGPTTDAKFLQEFRDIVGDIHGIIMEVGDEEGAYILQEYHWETPSFDPYTLAEDIENCAQKLLPMLERAAKTGEEGEDLFLDMCEALSESIDYYPEYIYTEEGAFFNQAATECSVVWLHLHSETEAQFLDKMIEFIHADHCISFEDSVIQKILVRQRPEAKRREFYQALCARVETDYSFREETATPHTLWHNVYYELAKKFDPERRIAIAEESLGKDWKKGQELVENAVAEDNIERALDICYKTINSYYRKGGGKDSQDEFNLRKTPLFNYYPEVGGDSIISKLYGQWAELADKKGMTQEAELLRIHQVFYTNPSDWTAVKRVFQEAEEAATSALFTAWRKRTLEYQSDCLFSKSIPKNPIWPAWLLDAGWAGEFHVFTEKALAWFDKTVPRKGLRTVHTKSSFHTLTKDEELPAQLSLVADLMALESNPGYKILAYMLETECALRDCRARREWLRKTDTDKLTAAGLEFTRRNILTFIPSPKNMSPNYELAAGWLTAAREIAPKVAGSVLRNWRVEHKRKRNLWRDLRAHGFDV